MISSLSRSIRVAILIAAGFLVGYIARSCRSADPNESRAAESSPRLVTHDNVLIWPGINWHQANDLREWFSDYEAELPIDRSQLFLLLESQPADQRIVLLLHRRTGPSGAVAIASVPFLRK